ncbi:MULTISPECIES: glycosyl hydrolase 115 family protein [Paenibacillus]|uniref:glycosyl hydrolase 115 family protein n=1 Tax=Paenibacillus TaxID=44249 RepID=UPI002041820D|nr:MULTISPECIES: glycosyl hydrolase 115 family protein [Paenibacillus]MCM2998496.1 glycosyl hydrolase 115 family protein [Paenibacillus cellulositrophicus]
MTERVNRVSREPSVKYRRIFINDEWPAFGHWAVHHFGGLNAEMYDHVFELILRLKGNYLWPAMWSSNFNCDGPGLLNAELADEYGIVMGTSHHEPCMRNCEEYKHVRGKDSIYGDAWDFRGNRVGILRFWEDCLKRNSGFENVITLGMRGEQDTTILGESATLADNVSLLRDVIERGLNTLRIYAVSPSLVLERIVLYPQASRLPESYLGPVESYYVKDPADLYR